MEYKEKMLEMERMKGGDMVRIQEAKAIVQAKMPFMHDKFEDVRKTRVSEIDKKKQKEPKPMNYGAGVVSSKAEGSQNLGGGFNSKQIHESKMKVKRQKSEAKEENLDKNLTGKAKELNDLFTSALEAKQPHIIFTNPEQNTDTAVWQPKIPPKKTPKQLNTEV